MTPALLVADSLLAMAVMVFLLLYRATNRRRDQAPANWSAALRGAAVLAGSKAECPAPRPPHQLKLRLGSALVGGTWAGAFYSYGTWFELTAY